MNKDRLVEMANDIGDYFKAEPVHEDAVDGVYRHLKKFWERRMQREILEHLDQSGGEGLHPIVLEAVHRLAREETA